MILVRRRLFFWLVKAYIKKWGSRIFLFFLFGLGLFFVLIKAGDVFIPKIPFGQKESIGMVGAYTLLSLPTSVLLNVSQGLTTVSESGEIQPGIAESWKILNNGKTYAFALRKDLVFNDGTPLTTESITFSFSDVTIARPNPEKIVFTLKDTYAPFLITVSKPLFKKGFVGVGSYKFKHVELNSNFVESLTLTSVKNQYDSKYFHFYPSEHALKTAFVLGEISKAVGLSSVDYLNTSFISFPNAMIQKRVNYNRLATIFFNTKDATVSDEKIRNALSYAIPDDFENGLRNYTPFSPASWVHNGLLIEKKQGFEHANRLITSSQIATKSAEITLQLKTLKKYEKDANLVAKTWNKLGFKTKIVITQNIPDNYQIFLGDFVVPKDPDQYTLWHSEQENNITRYSNLRIDKLLEDGRKTHAIEKRKKIYADFQKYLLADSPAAFLYFPYEYDVIRK